MKKGWKEKYVGEILQLEYGKPLDESDRKPNGRFPVYGANGEKDRTDKFYHDKPSIIVGRKGSAGEINLTETKFWPLDVTYFVTFDEQQHELRFLHYLLTTLELTKLAKGVKPGINRNEVYSQVTKVPPLPEQQRIVGILDEAFEGIATAKANAEKNLQNARALFESHLQSVFTQRGEGWKQKTLEEIATTFGRGKSKHRPRNEPKLYGGKYPFIQTGDIRNADHFTNPKEVEVGFVEYLLQSFKARLQAMGKGSAQANINMGTFENERFPFPSVTEQKQIVAKLDALSEETQRLDSIYEQKLAALEALKKSLLHQAFTGEL